MTKLAKHFVAAVATLATTATLAAPAATQAQQQQAPSNFSAQCKNPKSDAVAHTIKMIFEALSTDDCEKARASLARAMDLNLTHKNITDLSPLSEFNFLALDISHNKVTDFSFIKGMSKLKRIFADNNGIEDLSGMVNAAPQLTVVYVNNNNISDLSPLSRLKDMRIISARNNKLTSFDFSSHRKINFMDLSFNQIENIDKLGDQIRLMRVELRSNKIADLSPLTAHRDIWFLDVDDNKITSLEPVARLQKLMWFHGEGNQISDMAPVVGLPVIQGVYLGRNKLSTIPEISAADLSILYLESNEISDVSQLAGVAGLHTLALSNNKVADISPLKDLEGIQSFALAKNPLGTSEAKSAANCPTDAKSQVIVDWCSAAE